MICESRPTLDPGGRLAVLLNTRTGVCTVEVTVVVLFGGNVSVVVVVITAVFNSVPVNPRLTLTTTVRVNEEPLSSVPMFHANCGGTLLGCGDADTKVTPAGSGSVTITFCAALGPAFQTYSV